MPIRTAPNSDALALNAAWRRAQQNAIKEAHQAPTAGDKSIDVPPKAPAEEIRSIPLDLVFVPAGHVSRKTKIDKFSKIYRIEVKAGNDKPIIVQPRGDDVFVLVDGARRLACARQLGMKEIRAVEGRERK